MRLLSSLHSLYSAVFNRSRIGDELEEELRSHIQHRADDFDGLVAIRMEFVGLDKGNDPSSANG